MHPINIPHTIPPIIFSFVVVFLFLTVIFILFLPFIFYYGMISIERVYTLSIVTSKVKMMKYNFIVSFFIFIFFFFIPYLLSIFIIVYIVYFVKSFIDFFLIFSNKNKGAMLPPYSLIEYIC